MVCSIYMLLASTFLGISETTFLQADILNHIFEPPANRLRKRCDRDEPQLNTSVSF